MLGIYQRANNLHEQQVLVSLLISNVDLRDVWANIWQVERSNGQCRAQLYLSYGPTGFQLADSVLLIEADLVAYSFSPALQGLLYYPAMWYISQHNHEMQVSSTRQARLTCQIQSMTMFRDLRGLAEKVLTVFGSCSENFRQELTKSFLM